MSYIITKRTECEKCHGKGYRLMSADDIIRTPCGSCEGLGFTDTYHDFDEVLLSRLAKLRWNPRFTDNGTEWDEFDGMEMRDE